MRRSSLQQDFYGVGAAVRGYGKNRRKNGVGGGRSRPSTSTAFSRGDGGRNACDEYSWGSRKAVNLTHGSRVCENRDIQ